MEDPRAEIESVVRAIVHHPTPERQAETLRRFFAPNASYYHFYLNLGTGVGDLIAVYRLVSIVLRYQSVAFHSVVYDPASNAVALRMTIFARPLLSLGLIEVPLEVMALLELEDWPQEDGKILKRIKVQRDYFERAPMIQVIPVIGAIYGANTPRFWLGYLLALAFKLLQWLFSVLPGELLAAITSIFGFFFPSLVMGVKHSRFDS